MALDRKFQTIGVLASIIVDETLFAELVADGRVWEDSEFWRIDYTPKTRLVELFNCNSGTRSQIAVSPSGQLIAESFRFIPRQSGKKDDDRLWLQQHFNKIGL